jgi:3'-phosphoadenosine 5'-phosphosulfate sulfotransferase (PAPS reductase)/FAD synthetase
MYRHIEKVRKVIEDAGIKFTMIKAEHDFDYYLHEHTPERRNPELIGLNGKGWPNNRIRWCTKHLKIIPISEYFTEMKSKYNVIQCIGLAADETYRFEREHNQDSNHRHPLLEWGWTETDCLRYCYDRGYDWESLYEIFNRVSCWCCPLQPVGELRKLWKYFPDLWQQLREMDVGSWSPFKDKSVKEWEIRFQLEDEWEAQGLVPNARAKAFREALKERLVMLNETISTPD